MGIKREDGEDDPDNRLTTIGSKKEENDENND